MSDDQLFVGVIESQFFCGREDGREKKSERDGHSLFVSLIAHNPLSGSLSSLSRSHIPLS